MSGETPTWEPDSAPDPLYRLFDQAINTCHDEDQEKVRADFNAVRAKVEGLRPDPWTLLWAADYFASLGTDVGPGVPMRGTTAELILRDLASQTASRDVSDALDNHLRRHP